MQRADYAAAAQNCTSVYKFPIKLFDQQAGLVPSFSSIFCPSVFGGHFANMAFSQKTALKKSIDNNKRNPGYLSQIKAVFMVSGFIKKAPLAEATELSQTS